MMPHQRQRKSDHNNVPQQNMQNQDIFPQQSLFLQQSLQHQQLVEYPRVCWFPMFHHYRPVAVHVITKQSQQYNNILMLKAATVSANSNPGNGNH
jgi:hypothetical protein